MTYLEDLHTFEDQEQARAVSQPKPILLPYDLHTGLIIHGPLKGQHAGEAVWKIRDGHHAAGRETLAGYTHIHPWWRLWQPTPAVRIEVC